MRLDRLAPFRMGVTQGKAVYPGFLGSHCEVRSVYNRFTFRVHVSAARDMPASRASSLSGGVRVGSFGPENRLCSMAAHGGGGNQRTSVIKL